MTDTDGGMLRSQHKRTGERDIRIISALETRETIRVAAYCRVSTDEESQESSMEAQTSHWEQVIGSHSEWVLVGVYAETGVSGTHAETRPVLMRLIQDCMEGQVQKILTKSISRFSRNTVDCLNLVRTLKTVGTGVYFEKENIDTGSMSSEFFLSILSSFAAEESRSLSRNVKLGYRRRFQEGIFHFKRPPYGYDVDEKGHLVIHPQERLIVEEVFQKALGGMAPSAIARELQSRGVPTKYSATWTANTVSSILVNITYTGDCLFQKTYCDERFVRHINHGEQERYYVPAHHEGIVNREVLILANRTLGYSDPYAQVLPVAEEDMPDPTDESIQKTKVRVIRAQAQASKETARNKLRVAAYCRVSTDSEEQESSYEVQCSHYHELITSNVNWTLAGIYADEGISGTSLRHRDSFNRMIADAEAEKLDLILTKSISRFARNTLDCLSVVRRLKARQVGVIFEKEGLDTLDGTGEVILTILASIAQQESQSISQNVRMGIRYRFQQGVAKINCSRFIGYEKNHKGKLVIAEEQAVVVRRIYRDYLDGFSTDRIASDLRREGVPSGTGQKTWPSSTVRYILTNEKYAGDLLLQKTLVEDFLTHKLVPNRGQLPQYYVEDSHPSIVPKSLFYRVKDEMWLRGQTAKKGGNDYGSRKVLMGRTRCVCGESMRRMRRKEGAVFQCLRCRKEVQEMALKEQVMQAARELKSREDAVREKIEALHTELICEDRLRRCLAQKREWQLRNLLAISFDGTHTGACVQEDDFRVRTQKNTEGWNEDWLVRIVSCVQAGTRVVFCNEVEVLTK